MLIAYSFYKVISQKFVFFKPLRMVKGYLPILHMRKLRLKERGLVRRIPEGVS